MAVLNYADQQVFVKKESAFADTSYQSLAATDAILARTIQLTAAHNRTPSREKRLTPDQVSDLPRIPTAGWQLSAAWQPSGTLGTESDLAPLFEALQGTKTTSSVNTTVASGATVNGCVVAAAGTIAVGDIAIVTTTAGREAVRIKTVSTNTLTWEPPTSVAPSVGAAVVSGVSYKQATATPASLAVCNFMGSLEEAVIGAMVGGATLTFAKSDEVVVSFNGMGARYYGQGTASLTKPGSQTTVGAPINGLAAFCNVNGYSFKLTGLTITPNNALALRDQDIGSTYATEAFRSDRRNIAVQASFYVEDTRVMDLATAYTKAALSLCIGNTNGSMLAAVMPYVLWEISPLPQGETGPAIMTASGVAYASTTGNDALVVAEV